MGQELTLPFDAAKFALGHLRQIKAGQKMSSVAVNCGGMFVSLNFDDLRAGDVILFNDTSKADPIVAYQSQLLPASAARWTHAGIVDGNLLLWDAMPRLHVRSRPLREVLLERSVIVVFRPRISVDPDMLAESLVLFSNRDYRMFRVSTGGLLSARVFGYTGQRPPPHECTDDGVICSMFVDDVLRRTTGHPFFKFLPIVIPGDFANDPMFEAVAVEWCRIGP